MRRLPPVLLMALTVCVVHHNALPQNSLLAGELQLEGRIEKIEKGHLVIAANAFVNPNGKRNTITPPKNKVIVLPREGTPANLKVGENIAVIGRDGGVGKGLVARKVERLMQGTAVTASEQPIQPRRPPVGPPTGQRVLEFKGGFSPGWKAGDLNIRIEKAGFDYTTRFLPSNYSALEKMPVFYSIFQVRGHLPPGDIRKVIDIRRLIGPHREFVKPLDINFKVLPSDGEAARLVFWSSQVEPDWEFGDMDIDTVFGDNSAGKADTELVLENIPLPTEGEVPLNGEATSAFGTRYRAVKIKATQDKHWHLVVGHERATTPRDLQILSYSYQSTSASGGGGLTRGSAVQGEDEIFLAPSRGETEIRRMTIRFHEESRALQKRDGISRQRVRFPLSTLLKQSPPPLPDKPLAVLAQTADGPVIARVESQGLNWGDDEVGAVLFLRGTPDDIKRGVQWAPQKGILRVPGQPNAFNVSILNSIGNDFSYLWHVDATPKTADETVNVVLLKAPAGATRGDVELQLEGRAQFSTSFEKTVDVPMTKEVIRVNDGDDEATLVLRKIQRFSQPDEVANFPKWIRDSWPNAGLALVFEANPLLGDAEFLPYCLDAEDDQGRPLQRGIVVNNTLYQTDLTQKGNSPLYTLVVGEPAADAKSIKVWLRSGEKGRSVRKQSIQIKDVMLSRTK